jgi:thiamine biosynthesis lipoprotein
MQLYRYIFQIFGAPGELQFYAESKESAETAFFEVKQELLRVEKRYSRYDPESIISQINKAAGTSAQIAVDEETASLLDFANTCYETSEGLFDITSGILSRVWNFREKKVPTDTELQAVLPLVGWEKVQWMAPHISLPIKGMELDFGGFGKEYGVERGAVALQQCGIRHGFINLGGDIKVLGPHLDKTPWGIGISHPRVADEVLTSVLMERGALATSGDYERYFEVEGKRYCHILNPKTGFPVEGFQSVSIFHESALIAGCIATTVMVMSEQHEIAVGYLKEVGVNYLVVDKNGQQTLFC